MTATRRDVLTASGLAIAAAPVLAMAEPGATARIADDLDRYVAFGVKASGGPGDTACGAWVEAELSRVGFKVERQEFTAPYFDAERATLTCGAASAPVIPQAVVVPTGTSGLSGPLVRVDPIAGASGPLTGAVALVDLPYNRWSSALAKPIHDTVQAALTGGAAAAVLVTNGPTRKAIALNADGTKPMFDKPVVVLAPDQAKPFLVGALKHYAATLHVTGTGGRRPAFNLVGRIDRGKRPWIVVSTPRSGWFGCAGERGPGITAWLALARWAPAALPGYNLTFLCNSGHEYEYLGSEKVLNGTAPPPADTAFWLHLGANVAARDWQEIGAGSLLPLPSADSQRLLVTTPPLVDAARRAFAGQPGLEMAYPSGQGSAGELTNILGAGYSTVAGIFGAHRYHHVAEDDARCVDAGLVAPVIAACQRLLSGI